MAWPTQEQLDQATNHGIEYAGNEIANGNAAPQDGPLSGEWADGLLPREVAFNAGWKRDHETENDGDEEAIAALADAWETGYFDTWRTHCGEDCT